MADIPKLRGHHLVCLHFFSGKGYDSGFVENLANILKKASESGVEISSGADDICRRCPHLKGGKCLSSENSNDEIMAMDRFALSLLKEAPGNIRDWAAIRKEMPNIVPVWLENYCSQCSWADACEENPDYRRLSTEKTVPEIIEAYDKISPYIQKHTARLCPSCENVCCIDRHGRYDKDDLVFIKALGISKFDCGTDGPDADPCRFLQSNGCSLPRYKRPFRCTWYFCERLLESMNADAPREYRDFISAFEDLQRLRKEFLRNKTG